MLDLEFFLPVLIVILEKKNLPTVGKSSYMITKYFIITKCNNNNKSNI